MGFRLNRLLLAFINVFYLTISIALISIASIAYASPKVASVDLAVGLIVIGVCLLFLSGLGIIAAYSQNQAMLFFYSLLMLFIFVVQYALAIACLAAAHRNLVGLIRNSWDRIDTGSKIHIMNHYKCCSLDKDDWTKNRNSYLDFSENKIKADACFENNGSPVVLGKDSEVFNCGVKIEENIDELTSWCGDVALVFCFFEMFGVWLAMKFRNQRDPYLEVLNGGRRRNEVHP